ncbi:MAG TPA: glycosyltransferase [Allosphingosinicella sp.]|nr:glycosyltransferase [Allosphingosinicella sp.]
MFTVVVPVHDKARTLRRTVEHALRQTFDEFELILVDDGSTDGSIATVADLADPRLRILTQSRQGPGGARNRGIAEARHEWVAFLDGDDLWHPDHLAELDRIRRQHPEAALIGTAHLSSDSAGRFAWPRDRGGRIEPFSYLAAIGRGEKTLITSSAAARTSILREMGGFGPTSRGEDAQLWVRIALAYPLARSTRVTVVYVHGTGGITETLVRPWSGAVPAGPEALSPAIATALAARPSASPALQSEIDAFVRRNLRWWLDSSASRGDRAAVRTIAGFHLDPLPLEQRAKLLASRLPDFLAGPAMRLVASGAQALRRLASGLGGP